MTKKILVNAITSDGISLEGSNLTALLTKIKVWQSRGYEVTIFGGAALDQRIKFLNIIKNHQFVPLEYVKLVNNRASFLVEALKRNLVALFYINKFRNKYDIVYSISSVLDLLLFPYALKLFDRKVKMAAVFDNTVSLSDSPGNPAVRLLVYFLFKISLILLRKADTIFAISQELKNFLIQGGFDEQRVAITGNAIEVELMKEAKADERYHIDALFVGRINKAKGIYDMLNVLGKVVKQYPDFQLALMGKGDLTTEEKFRQTIKEMRLEKNVQFLGYKTGLEKFNIVKSSRCFWFLSWGESFGISLFEAVCLGLPALAYDLEAYKNIYKNNEIFAFKKGDWMSVADKVIELFQKNEFDNKTNEYMLFNHGYTWEMVGEKEFNAFNQTG